MTFDTLKHIESMQATALALEEQARASGRYTRDCDKVHDAIARGHKSGVALLWGADGKLEIVDLNGGSKHVCVKETDGNGVSVEHSFPSWTNEQRSEKHRDETKKIVEEAGSAYEPIDQESFKGMAAHSHERENATKGRFNPVNHAGPPRSLAKGPTRPTGDAARRAKMTADAKREYEAGIARTERIAQQMKQASDKQWAGRR